VKVATLRSGPGQKVVLGPLLDVVTVSCHPESEWWTLTERRGRVVTPILTAPQAFQQSWIQQPAEHAE
jgi:hypothetical protein